MVSRVTFELEEQIASALREEQLRGEYAQAAETFRTKLSEEAAQRFHYLEQPSGIAFNFPHLPWWLKTTELLYCA